MAEITKTELTEILQEYQTGVYDYEVTSQEDGKKIALLKIKDPSEETQAIIKSGLECVDDKINDPNIDTVVRNCVEEAWQEVVEGKKTSEKKDGSTLRHLPKRLSLLGDPFENEEKSYEPAKKLIKEFYDTVTLPQEVADFLKSADHSDKEKLDKAKEAVRKAWKEFLEKKKINPEDFKITNDPTKMDYVLIAAAFLQAVVPGVLRLLPATSTDSLLAKILFGLMGGLDPIKVNEEVRNDQEKMNNTVPPFNIYLPDIINKLFGYIAPAVRTIDNLEPEKRIPIKTALAAATLLDVFLGNYRQEQVFKLVEGLPGQVPDNLNQTPMAKRAIVEQAVIDLFMAGGKGLTPLFVARPEIESEAGVGWALGSGAVNALAVSQFLWSQWNNARLLVRARARYSLLPERLMPPMASNIYEEVEKAVPETQTDKAFLGMAKSTLGLGGLLAFNLHDLFRLGGIEHPVLNWAITLASAGIAFGIGAGMGKRLEGSPELALGYNSVDAYAEANGIASKTAKQNLIRAMQGGATGWGERSATTGSVLGLALMVPGFAVSDPQRGIGSLMLTLDMFEDDGDALTKAAAVGGADGWPCINRTESELTNTMQCLPVFPNALNSGFAGLEAGSLAAGTSKKKPLDWLPLAVGSVGRTTKLIMAGTNPDENVRSALLKSQGVYFGVYHLASLVAFLAALKKHDIAAPFELEKKGLYISGKLVPTAAGMGIEGEFDVY